MQYMPLFVDMHQRHVLIVGGGEVALRKARQFSEAGAYIKVIAPEIKPEFSELPKVSLIKRKVGKEDVSREYFAVVIATNDQETNKSLSKICRKNSIIADRCDDHSKSDFVTGSIAVCGTIINSTISGGIPSLSRFINLEVKKLFTQELEELNRLLQELRPAIIASSNVNKKFLKNIVNQETLKRIKTEGINSLKEEITACL